MHRLPAAAWILAPLILAIVYVLAHGLLAPSPSLLDVVPEEAILMHRFENRRELDRGWLPSLETIWRTTPPEPGTSPSERMARDRNLGGLPGVDASRPFHLVLLPRRQRPNPTMMILPVRDASELEAQFEDPSFFLEKGYIRRAQHLAVRGDFAAVGGDADAVQQLGTGGITAEPLGEDHVIACRIPDLARFALAAPWESPWRGALDALGVRPESTSPEGHPLAGTSLLVGRLLRVTEAWREARMWSWREEHRVRLVLEPAPGRLADLLRIARARAPEPSPVPPAPLGSLAWIYMPDAPARAVLARALWDAGVAFPEPSGREAPLGALARPDEGSGMLLYATASPGTGHAWTIGLVAARDGLLDLPLLFPAIPLAPGEVPVAEGELEVTRSDLQRDRTAPAGRIVRREIVGKGDTGYDVVLLGAAPDDAESRLVLTLASGEQDGIAPVRPWVEEVGEGERLIAAFFLTRARARTLLGDTLLGPGGLLGVLNGGDLVGAVFTNGRTLRVEILAKVRPSAG